MVTLTDEGRSGGAEPLLPGARQQVEGGGLLGCCVRLESGPVCLPVTGSLMVEPRGEVVAGHQVRDDRRGMIAEDFREAGRRQDVREEPTAADARKYFAVQLGQGRLKSGHGVGGEEIGQGRVAVDE